MQSEYTQNNIRCLRSQRDNRYFQKKSYLNTAGSVPFFGQNIQDVTEGLSRASISLSIPRQGVTRTFNQFLAQINYESIMNFKDF